MASAGRYSRAIEHREKRLGQALGALSIGFGVVDLLAARRIARFLGMRGGEGLIRACGAREVVSGLGLMAFRKRMPWILSRVGGDAIDVAGLMMAFNGKNRQKRNVGLMLAAVLGITALDLLYARRLSRAGAARGIGRQEIETDLAGARAAEREMELLYGAEGAPKAQRSTGRRRLRSRQRQEMRAAA